ncbi:MAG: DUF3160 domain-containing protein, partial [Acidimicrobiia bacterium]
MRKTTAAVAVLLAGALAGACTDDGGAKGSTSSAVATSSSVALTSTTASATTMAVTTTTMASSRSALGAGRPVAAFAPYRDVPLLSGAPYGGPATPRSLSGVLFTDVEYTLSDPVVRTRLTDNGFVVVSQKGDPIRMMFEPYDASMYDRQPIYVTTDVAYNVWHQVFDHALRTIETDELLPVLERFARDGVAAARAQQSQLQSTKLADPAGKVVALFEAEATLLGIDVGSISPLASDEVDLAMAATDITSSPVSGTGACNPQLSMRGCVDYTQFIPRGHYTLTPDLERYFRGMALLGQESFSVTDPTALRVGLLTSRVVQSTKELRDAWTTLYEPTAFLVGLADDYTPVEAWSSAGTIDVSTLADDSTITKISSTLQAARSVGIDPDAAAVRVMGARFVLDSAMLDQLTFPNVGTPQNPRVLPSAIDVAASFGSDLAVSIQSAAGQAGPTGYVNYDQRLAENRSAVASRSSDDWGTTVYDAWLHAIAASWASHGASFPDYMRSAAWTAKDLQSGIGSYTELKHDTILYAKQGFAGEGDGEPPAVPPRHWVEPDPVVFERLSAAAGLMRDGMQRRSLLPTTAGRMLTDLVALLDHLAAIA